MAGRQYPGATTPGWPDTVDRLLGRVARGDRGAFAAVYDQVAGPVYDQVAGPVYGLVHRMVGDPARAEQVTAEVLTDVWRTAPEFSPSDGSGISWIMTIARRRAIAYLGTARKPAGRRTRRPDLAQLVTDISERAGLDRPGPPDAALPDSGLPDSGLPDSGLPDSGLPDSGLPDEAPVLAALPEPQRQALVLVCYGGYGQGQAAALLGVPAGTVAGWIREGLPLLAHAAS